MVSCRWIDRCYHRCGPYIDCSAPLSVGISAVCLVLICLLHIGLTYRDIIDYQPLQLHIDTATVHHTSAITSAITGLFNGASSCQCVMAITYTLSPAAIAHLTGQPLPSKKSVATSTGSHGHATATPANLLQVGHTDVICDCGECICEAPRNTSAWIDKSSITYNNIAGAQIRMTPPAPLWTFHNIALYGVLMMASVALVVGYGYVYGWQCHMFGMSDGVRYRQIHDNEWRDMQRWQAHDDDHDDHADHMSMSTSTWRYGETELSSHNNKRRGGRDRDTRRGDDSSTDRLPFTPLNPVTTMTTNNTDTNTNTNTSIDAAAAPYHERQPSMGLSGLGYTDSESPLVSPQQVSSHERGRGGGSSMSIWPPPANKAVVAAAISSLTDNRRYYGSSDMRL